MRELEFLVELSLYCRFTKMQVIWEHFQCI